MWTNDRNLKRKKKIKKRNYKENKMKRNFVTSLLPYLINKISGLRIKKKSWQSLRKSKPKLAGEN